MAIKIPFQYVNPRIQRGKIFGERSDCIVRAGANATGRPYDELHAIAIANGRKVGHGMPTRVLLDIIPSKRILTHELYTQAARKGDDWNLDCTYGNRRAQPIYPTLSQMMPLLQKGRFVVTVAGHGFAVVDGVVLDDSPPRARKRVDGLWEIL